MSLSVSLCLSLSVHLCLSLSLCPFRGESHSSKFASGLCVSSAYKRYILDMGGELWKRQDVLFGWWSFSSKLSGEL